MMPELKYPSPGGTYVFHIYPWEARMSHWIECPKLVEVASGASLLSFKDSNWSLDRAEWLNASTVSVTLRKYPGDHTPSGFEVTLDCTAKTAALADRVIPLNKLETELQKLYATARNTGLNSPPSLWRTWVRRLRLLWEER